MAKQTKVKTSADLLREINEIFGEQVPVEVKNIEAYYDYLKLSKNPIHSIKLKIGRETVPITHPYPVIKQKAMKALDLEYITAEEAEKIKDMKMVQQKIKMQSMAKLTKSYGTHVTADGTKREYKSVFEPVKEQMIEIMGRMFTDKEVLEICITQWKITVKLNNVNDFRRKHITEINKRIEEHKRTYSDIRLGHKRSRLEELVWLYNRRKRIYEVTNKGEDHRLLLSTLEQIKREAEGDVLRIDGTLNIALDVTINEHIQKDINKTLPIKEIILARVAAKTNADPTKLMSYLNQSLYRKVLDQVEEAEVVEMPQYPSLQNYDFDKIRRQQESEVQEKLIEAKVVKQVDHIKVNEAEALRQMMLKKLSGNKGDLNREKNNLSGNFDSGF